MIIIECQACRYAKTLTEKEIWDIRSNYGFYDESNYDIFERIKWKFRCTKCRAKGRCDVIINEEL